MEQNDKYNEQNNEGVKQLNICSYSFSYREKYVVDIIFNKEKGIDEFWLYRKDKGIKMLMWAIKSQQSKEIKHYIDLAICNLDCGDYIRTYENEFLYDEEERLDLLNNNDNEEV